MTQRDSLADLAGIPDEDYYINLETPDAPARPPLTDPQSLALEALLEEIERSQEASLSGAAGTGKTTMIYALVDSLTRDGLRVVVCAPTNKAAAVLVKKGVDAATIHRRFFVPIPKSKPLKFVPTYKWVSEGKPLPEGKIDFADVIIVDEASMLHSRVLSDLRMMTDHLILIGDGNQLPPVNDSAYPAGYFNALRHTATLTEVLRQDEGSAILSLATGIRKSTPFLLTLKTFFPEEPFSKLAGEPGIKFIAYTNKERSRLNRLIRLRHGLSSALPDLGETMICASNYSDVLLNGTEVILEGFCWDGKSREADAWLKPEGYEAQPAKVDMLAFFNDLQQLQHKPYMALCAHWQGTGMDDTKDEALSLRYGYCITAHAAQGSEYETVCVIDQCSTVAYMADQNLAKEGKGMPGKEAVRRWLYTAITRAKTNLFIAPTWYAGSVIESEA